MGDFNIDLLKFQSHEKTKYFIESMLTTGYLPVLTKPTRVTDHALSYITWPYLFEQQITQLHIWHSNNRRSWSFRYILC